ncbi:hypothetical protein HYQ45_010967 [Verticillium longisporum]|uniref:SWIM-type domain-containing protein n=1 Tax=Verticillium longisporum TaxID=100787 RepID=A0A8I2ZHB9_VERLO|nr:hypothetical protein HYQ44_016360 [Verticillium longisporum]KAG7130053.1 hypothetical protein HYQ45_010967 [Verticillium longisporum]
MTLPTPGAVLTSLLNTITSVPAPATSPNTAPSNPLSHLPPAIRPLLATLHVLYPTLLLPALDLLDRSLVTRVLPERAVQGETAENEPAAFYLVRSAAATSKRNAYAATLSAPYIVHLDAWNCSCANFAYEAFPISVDGDEDILEAGTDVDGPAQEEAVEWRFGGMSSDGQDSGAAVSCCKHLLASLLAERWKVLGNHAVERRVSRTEMAGMVAEI